MTKLVGIFCSREEGLWRSLDKLDGRVYQVSFLFYPPQWNFKRLFQIFKGGSGKVILYFLSFSLLCQMG